MMLRYNNLKESSKESEASLEKIEKFKEQLQLIKKDIAKRDLLYNLAKVSPGDYIITFRRSGEFSGPHDAPHLSMKRLLEHFGFYAVDRKIIPRRHEEIRAVLEKHGLLAEDAMIQATFKTDTYFIKAAHWIKNKSFCELEKKEMVALLEKACQEIQQNMQKYIVSLKNIEGAYRLTAGICRVTRKGSIRLYLNKDYLVWKPWFWQRIAKSNSMKAAIIADLDGVQAAYFSKRAFDQKVGEIVELNNKLSKTNYVEKYWHFSVLKKSAASRISKGLHHPIAQQYFSTLILLEEIITYPLSFNDAIKIHRNTVKLISQIDKGIMLLLEAQQRRTKRDQDKARLREVHLLLERAIKYLSVDVKNPEFSSDLKFFLSDLKDTVYRIIYIDIRNAGVKIRLEHEKKLLWYHARNYAMSEFIKMSFHAYDKFFKLIRENQKKVRALVRNYMKDDKISLLSFGDEILVLLPDDPSVKYILNDIKKLLDVNVRIVSTRIDFQKDNKEGSKMMIGAFNRLSTGDRIVKKYESEVSSFDKVILVDKDYSYKLMEEITVSLESMKDMYVFTSMVSGEFE